MTLDAIFAMIIYTLVTAAFYLLGAAILFKRGEIPEGNFLIEKLALIYTESLGPGVKTAYLIGAFFVLFSSVFATCAAMTRLYSDGTGVLGWYDRVVWLAQYYSCWLDMQLFILNISASLIRPRARSMICFFG